MNNAFNESMTMQPPQNLLVFDIETQKTFDEVGGDKHMADLGVSFVGVYSYSQQKEFGFFEKDLPLLEKALLTERPTLVGFNSIHFDVPVLQPYFSTLDLSTLSHLDILREAEKVLGHRLKLDSIAQGTLGTAKSGSGLDAIRWYREGDMESLAKYCLDDVRITRDIYEFGLRHGNLYYPSGGEILSFATSWKQEPTIFQRLQDAFTHHKKVRIEYMDIESTGERKRNSYTVEILSLTKEAFEAFCEETNTKQSFRISHIWDIQETEETFVRQGSLFG